MAVNLDGIVDDTESKGKGVESKSKEVRSGKKERKWVKTGVPGFDELMTNGIPESSSILVCGGCGTGKTIFCLQTLWYGIENGETCLYVSLEETEEKLRQHMEDFGWDPAKYEKTNKLVIKRIRPFEISRSVEGMLAKARGEIDLDIKEVSGLIPKGITPNRVVIDSLSALSAAFTGKPESYRIYIEQLFDYFKKINAITFLISETEQVPTTFSRLGVEEFLADGVFVLYNVRQKNVKVRATEILKLRGEQHETKMVPLTISPGKGIEIFSQQRVFDRSGSD